jgi:hypothetical protein
MVVEAPDGLLITRQDALASRALDRIGEVLEQQGLSVEELIESGCEGRGELIKERYGDHRGKG